jgi:hypothetical protein
MLCEMEKSAAWKLKYQFGFNDEDIKGIRRAAKENVDNDIKEYGYEEGFGEARR